uniref:Calcineurin-like phosphoesterase domain-containing protein n=1 Tax=Percolomonas cosmopolitus TaxID=63605 RepID=A0A7S1PH49_9EUKA
MPTSTTHKSFSFLLISDIHERQSNLDHIRPDLLKQADYVVCLGDVCNLDNGGLQPDDKTTHNPLHESELDVDQSMLSTLRDARTQCDQLQERFVPQSKDSSDKSAARFYWIPGNHDTYLDYLPEKTSSSHNKIVDIDSRLFMAFFGGAVPGYRQKDGVQEWDGYPYKSDAELLQSMTDLREKVEYKLKEHSDKQVILFTHCGPSESQTTLFWKDTNSDIITSGSQSMSEWLKTKEMQRQCVANLHGHTHPATGKAHIAKVPVINVGSIREGRYAYMDVIFDEKDDKYKVGCLQLFEFHVEDPYGMQQKTAKKKEM